MGNEDLIVGSWGKYTFRTILPEDIDKIIKHVKENFLRDEPTSALLGYTDEYGEEFGELVKKLVKDGLSFWAEDNETGDVAAVRLTFRHKRDTAFDDIKVNSKTFKELFRLVGICDKGCDLFKYYNLEEFANFFVASCAKKYRRQGIVSEMYRRSLLFLAAEGFTMVKSVFTSPFTRAAARNLGFEEVYRVYYKDIMDDDGNPVFDKSTLHNEHYAAVMCKLL